MSSPRHLYRAMKQDMDGKPLCGTRANELGVRPKIDITADADGMVQPQTGGLSTTPDDPGRLPPHVRPPSLGGKGKLTVFKIAVGDLGDDLATRRDPEHPLRHGFVEPAKTMALTVLQALFCSGRDDWKVVP